MSPRPLLLLTLWAGYLTTPQFALAAPSAEETAAVLKSTVERLNALNEWFSEAERKRSAWLVELQRSDRDIAQLNQAVARISAALEEIERDLAELRTRRTELGRLRQEQAALIATHISASHRLRGQDFLKQLLNQESPDTFARMIRYHRYFSESRLSTVQTYQQTLTDLEQTNAALTTQQQRQTERQKELLEEQQTLANDRQSRTQLIAMLDAEKETKASEYARLERDRARLEQLLAELRRRTTDTLDGADFKAARGNLSMPAKGRIRHAFGSRRADGRLRWHGIDIAAAHGTPVAAVFRGRVVFADWLRGFGYLTIVDHGSEYMTLYGHADVLYKKVGDWVEAGERIAGAGNSGGNKEPGIYFEIRRAGAPLDPISWVNR